MADTDLTGCPVCGAALCEHTPENHDEWECWYFDCGAEIYREGRKFHVSEECGLTNPTQSAVNKLNAALPSTECEGK